MSKEQYRNEIDPTLHKYFYVDSEVWSVCRTKRIDYVLKCKQSDALFGLEVKKKIIHRGSEIGKYLKQAFGYSELIFNSKFGKYKLPIFISPAISKTYKEVKPKSYKNTKGVETFEPFHVSQSKHANINGLVGSFNVGEIRNFEYFHKIYGYKYFSFIFRNSEIWRSKNNYSDVKLNENNYNKMMQLIK